MNRRWTAAALTLAATTALLLGACSSDDKTAATTTTKQATTTAAVVPSSTAATNVANTPEAYAKALYADWQANDKTAAHQVASELAVSQMFGVAYLSINDRGPTSPYTFQTCEGAAGSFVCTWNADTRQIQMTVRDLTGGQPIQVTQVLRAGP
ncbi:MAG: hypothetical protein JWL73_3631 [Actinomycetia bacterium]|nr:hypothetical protein [Actinomycetes bacterium]